MSKVIEEVTERSASATLTASGSARWLAPELIEGAITSPTKEADTYSYAMAILELFTGKHPFSHRRRDASVIHDIVVLKKTPPRPNDSEVGVEINDGLWKLMQECWYAHAESRPSMAQVAACIQDIEDDQTPEEDDPMIVEEDQ
jgi:serine/threonine protein kinase